MTRRTIEIIAFCAALIIAALAIQAWLGSRADQQRLQSTLADQKRVIDTADADERSRQTTLNATLAQIADLKRTTQTPEQILRDLPKYLSLPQPITLVQPPAATAGNSEQGTAPPEIRRGQDTETVPQPAAQKSGSRDTDSSLPSAPSAAAKGKTAPRVAGTQQSPPLATPCNPASPDSCAAQIPAADLKPLYDYVQDCRTCQAQLAAAKQNQTDDATKITALTRERDAAVTAAKGGTFWHRLRRNAAWFAIGAGLGAAATMRR
jgi:hypothetical protein